MLAEPALPWSAGEGGRISFRASVSPQEILDGKLKILVGDNELCHVAFDSDANVYYIESPSLGAFAYIEQINSRSYQITIYEGVDASIKSIELLAEYPIIETSVDLPTNETSINVIANAILTPAQWASKLRLQFSDGDWVESSQASQFGWQWVNPLNTAVKYSANIPENAAKITLTSATYSNNLTGIKVAYPIPVMGDVQVFKDPNCYDLATGSLSKVYVRINKPWVGNNSGWVIGSDEINNAYFRAISPVNGEGSYSFELWGAWSPTEQNIPYEAGQIVEANRVAGALNVTTFETDFEKPLYIEGYSFTSYETLKPNKEIAHNGEVGAVIGMLWKDSSDTMDVYLTQDGVNAIGGVVDSSIGVEVISNGSLATDSVLNTAQKPNEVTVGVKIKILKTAQIQVLYDERDGEHDIIIIKKPGEILASIGDSAPLYINPEL